MVRFFPIIILFFLAACSPAPETDVAPAPPSPAPEATSWPDRFRQLHGSAYDPNSRVDREKMAALKGEAVIKDSLTTHADVLAPTVKESLTVRNHPEFPDGSTIRNFRIVRDEILTVARPLIGQKETHGSNRSPAIDAMNRLTGVAMGSPYCASFNAWCYSEGKAPPGWPKSAWSPDWVKSPTWTAAKGGRTPQPGDAFGIWFSNKGRVAHTGLIEKWDGTSAVTIEGNTSPSAEFGAASDRDGDGVWRKRRLVKQIHSVRDWIH